MIEHKVDATWTLGPLFVGSVVNTYLFGIGTYQLGMYCCTKFNDPLWIKITVWIMCFVNTIQGTALMYMMWDQCITRFGIPPVTPVTSLPWPASFSPALTAVAAALTHNLLAFRIYRLTGIKFLYVAILFTALLCLAAGVSCGVGPYIMFNESFSPVPKITIRPIWRRPFVFWLILQSSLDLIISGLLVRFFYLARTGGLKMDQVIRKLIRGTVQTGSFAAIFVLGDLLSFFLARDTLLYQVFAIPIGTIYMNTLLDMLILRQGLREVLAQPPDIRTITISDGSHSTWGGYKSIVRSSDHLSKEPKDPTMASAEGKAVT